MTPLILTYTGKHVNPLDLKPEDIDIFDIAHALALCNRFAGHTKRPISVAQHSVYVSRLLEEHQPGCDYNAPGKYKVCQCGAEDFARQGLFHDASEAYLGDVTKWLKHSEAFLEYRKAESRVQKQIYKKFGCQLADCPELNYVDKLMLRFEGEQGFGNDWERWLAKLKNYTPVTEIEKERIGAWKPWTWKAAEEAFLVRARELGVIV